MIFKCFFCLLKGSKRHHEELEAETSSKMKDDKPTINQLPNEILLEIFSRMDHQTLLKSLQVNKQWNQIIAQSPATMKHIRLTVNGDRLRIIPKLTRKYQFLTIIEATLNRQKLFNECMKIGGTIKELSLYECDMSQHEFLNLMACFPSVKKLSIDCCSLFYPMKKLNQKAELTELKELSIKGDVSLLDNISCQLEELNASQLDDDGQKYLVNFLNGQGELKSLSLHYIADMFSQNICDKDIGLQPTFNLRFLSLSSISFVDETQLLKLLERAHACESLHLGFEVPRIALQYALNNCDELLCLSIDVEHLPNKSFYYGLKPNNSLKVLLMNGQLDSTEDFLAFLSHYPMLEFLNLISIHGITAEDSDVWKSLSILLKQIVQLKLHRCSLSNLVQLKFPLMTSLTIDQMENIDSKAWEDFNKNNPNLKYLKINSMARNAKFNALAVVESLKKLRQLKYNNFVRW